MINDYELMIGNIIQVKGKAGAYRLLGIVNKSAGLHESKVWVERPEKQYEPIVISDIKGIPLTPFTVKKLGFIFGGAHWYHPDNPDWFIWNISKGTKEIFKAITHHRNAGNKPNENHVELHFVHELQNRFFIDNKIKLDFDTLDLTEHKI